MFDEASLYAAGVSVDCDAAVYAVYTEESSSVLRSVCGGP